MSEQELKDAWRREGHNLSSNVDMPSMTVNTRRTTALQRLADRYRRFSFMGLMLAFLGIVTGLNPHIIDTEYRLVYIVWYSGLMLVCAVIDRYLYMKVSDINVVTMPTMTVIKRAMECRKLHLRSICFLLPLAIGFVSFIAWVFSDEKYALYGIVCGFTLGLVVGLFKLAEFMRDYRNIFDED